MESKEPKVMDNKKGDLVNMKAQIEKEIREEIEGTKRRERFKNGLKLVALVGIGAGIYGFKVGREIGLRRGIEAGYITAGQDMIEALKEYAQELRLSRGE